MRVVAVVPHRETPRETVACLKALASSHHRLHGVIVVDDGSRDGSGPALAADPTVTVLISPTNVGFSAACNLGIERALEDGAEAVLILNSDAEVAPDCVTRLLQAIGDGIGVAGAAVVRRGPPASIESLGIRFSPRSGRMRNLAAGERDGARPSGLLEVEGVMACCMLVRREVFERVGRFAPELFYGFEDLELCLRAARAGFRIASVPQATVWHLGARTIGPRSPERLYFASRNHLLVAERAAPLSPAGTLARAAWIVALNLAHALWVAPAPRIAGLRAVVRGVRDHLRRRYGPLRA